MFKFMIFKLIMQQELVIWIKTKVVLELPLFRMIFILLVEMMVKISWILLKHLMLKQNNGKNCHQWMMLEINLQ